MNITHLKNFARAARRTLMDAVSAKLSAVLAKDSMARREFPLAVAELEKAISTKGRAGVVDFVAYTWFNRFCALRFMDVMGYNLVRVVSPQPNHMQPEILEEAKSGNFDSAFIPERSRAERIRGLLSGTIPSPDVQTEAYKLLLVSACNSFNRAMPFLFQPINDYTELLMPDDLMSDNSILALTREALPQEVAAGGVEVIGWLYQFYISEKKDEVMGKTVKTEDIPAATQLFTPDWIVRYLVQNSLGRLWLLNHPDSKLAEEMEYYIPATEQDNDFLEVKSPEELKICDPCCGSGHMLTYAFDLLVKIYEEAGYAPREIPSLILKNNLFGVEIDTRAGELAAFALTMKAREYDNRFLQRQETPKPNICVLQNMAFSDHECNEYLKFVGRDLFTSELQKTLQQFDKADCFGSLIIPQLADPGAVLTELEGHAAPEQLELDSIHKRVLAVLRQAEYLAPRYHVVVTNPPYMGGGGMNADLKSFAGKKYPDSKSDLFAMFIERCLKLAKPHGTIGMITMQSWMFLSSFEKLRGKLLSEDTILTMAHLGARAFDSIGGEVVQTTAFTMANTCIKDYQGAFIRLVDGNNEAEKSAMFIQSLKTNIGREEYD